MALVVVHGQRNVVRPLDGLVENDVGGHGAIGIYSLVTGPFHRWRYLLGLFVSHQTPIAAMGVKGRHTDPGMGYAPSSEALVGQLKHGHDPVLGPQDFSSVYVNDIVTCIFVVEMIVKVPSMAYLAHCDRFSTISVLGYRVATYKSSWSAMAYFTEPLNLIDAGVVTLGIIEFVAA